LHISLYFYLPPFSSKLQSCTRSVMNAGSPVRFVNFPLTLLKRSFFFAPVNCIVLPSLTPFLSPFLSLFQLVRVHKGCYVLRSSVHFVRNPPQTYHLPPSWLLNFDPKSFSRFLIPVPPSMPIFPFSPPPQRCSPHRTTAFGF